LKKRDSSSVSSNPSSMAGPPFQEMASRIGRGIDATSRTKQGLWKRVDHTAIAFLLANLTEYSPIEQKRELSG
jgi:hypothetical protein